MADRVVLAHTESVLLSLWNWCSFIIRNLSRSKKNPTWKKTRGVEERERKRESERYNQSGKLEIACVKMAQKNLHCFRHTY
jgi:hypothetical protein